MTNEPEMIRNLRKQNRITIVELSARTGIPQATISLYERGKMKLPKETVEVLLKALEKRE
jgi:transcriptional regulator with XRE-family HTH domain